MGVNEYIQIGTRIKRIRLSKNVTQRQMAEILKIPYSTYSNYENNNREPNSETISMIADALGVSVEYLVYGESGIITAETAQYLLTLAGYNVIRYGDGIYKIQDIQNNKVVDKIIVDNKEMDKFIHDTSDYIIYLVNKMFKDKHSNEIQNE